MEDVVLHCHPGSATGLSFLLETTEKLLASFPCRTLPVFTPWFSTTADCHLPIRPAKAAPVITIPESRSAQNRGQRPRTDGAASQRPQESLYVERSPHESNDGISETMNCLLPAKPEITRLSPDKHKRVTASLPRRSWSIFMQGGVVMQRSQPLSKQFSHMVSVHRLHLRQRVKWVISQQNCGATRDIEQVWRSVNRFVRMARLPMCNANVQSQLAEIWVYCDVVHSEQVGHFLKDELQLCGEICLVVRRRGNIFRM